jgi:hypothetical protein
MTRSRKLSVAAVLSLGVLVACGGGGAIGDAVAQFGTTFGQSFRAAAQADPMEPAAITYRSVTDANATALATLEPVNF